MNKFDVLVIGAGASGMTAALTCAKGGKKIVLLEKEIIPGRKILITGNGRCNFTNKAVSPDKYFGAKDLAAEALKNFTLKDCLSFFDNLGLLYKEEEGRFFPVANKSSAVVDCFKNALIEAGVDIRYGAEAVKINKGSVKLKNGDVLYADNIILACGSRAFPQTGAGDFGYELASQLGHKITDLKPALSALNLKEKAVARLAGLKITAKITVLNNGKPLDSETNEVIFNNNGISGNNVLSLSRHCKEGTQILIDFLPDFTQDNFALFMKERLSKMQDRKPKDFFCGILPDSLANLLIDYLGVKKNSPVSELKADIFARMISIIKAWPLTVESLRPWKEVSAVCGGVDAKDIKLSFESKLAKGVYITGELLDIDGRCGGYNLHFAWASGYTAAKNILAADTKK